MNPSNDHPRGLGILAGIQRFTVETDRETLEIHRLGVFDGRMVELVELNAGQHYPPHIHHHSTARLQVLVGRGVIALNDVPHTFAAGSVFDVPAGTSHGFDIVEQTVLFSTQDPPIYDAPTGNIDVTYVKPD